jgi:O-antigen/teichoic acid export membrane protein
MQVLRIEAVRSTGAFLIPVILLWIMGSRNYRLLLLGIALAYAVPLCGLPLRRVRHQPQSQHARRWYPSVPERQILREMLRFGWPVALWMLCQQGMLVSDRFFLQKFVGYSAAGAYASMYDVIVRSFSLSFMPIRLAVHPLVMKHWNSGFRPQALRAIRSGIKYQFLSAIPVVGSLLILAPLVCRLVLGKASAGAAPIVAPLAVGGFLWQVSLLAHKPLEILCQTRRMLAGILVAIAVNVVGNWLLVPRFGYRAPAYLTVASSASYLLMLFVLTPREKFTESVDQAKTTVVTNAPALHCASPEEVSTQCR